MTLTEMADLYIPEALSNGGVPLDGVAVLFSARMTAKYGHVVSDAARFAANAIAGKLSDGRGPGTDRRPSRRRNANCRGVWYDDELRMITYCLGNFPRQEPPMSLFAQGRSDAVPSP
jgi:hypothetical protein